MLSFLLLLPLDLIIKFEKEKRGWKVGKFYLLLKVIYLESGRSNFRQKFAPFPPFLGATEAKQVVVVVFCSSAKQDLFSQLPLN